MGEPVVNFDAQLPHTQTYIFIYLSLFCDTCSQIWTWLFTHNGHRHLENSDATAESRRATNNYVVVVIVRSMNLYM